MGYLERLASYEEDMVRTLGESVAFPSVAGDPVRTADGELMPYGRPVHEALLHMLKAGEELGFESHNVDNYAGYIDFVAPEVDGKAPKQCAVVGHLDVVPEGTDWATEPYVMTEKDGYFYARGTSDDKGPVVACLYAMKALKEEGIVPKNTIRLVLGLDEECGESSMNYYTDKCGHPDMGFTPDGDFPIVNGEMGIMVFDLAQKLSSGIPKDELRLTKVEGGLVHNSVPKTCKAVLAGDSKHFDNVIGHVEQFCEETGYKLKARKQGASLALEAEGLAAHGAHPDLGLNANSIMMAFLGRINFADDALNDFIAFYNDHVGFDLHGERLGIPFEDEPSGKLILNVGLANFTEELASVTINVRYPVTKTDKDLVEGIESVIRDSRVGIVVKMVQGPVYMDMGTDMVKKLFKAYQDETGDFESKPIVAPAGTYAKMVNNILCYGGLFPGEEDTMHQANEQFSRESFMKMAKVYARALYLLCCE